MLCAGTGGWASLLCKGSILVGKDSPPEALERECPAGCLGSGKLEEERGQEGEKRAL